MNYFIMALMVAGLSSSIISDFQFDQKKISRSIASSDEDGITSRIVPHSPDQPKEKNVEDKGLEQEAHEAGEEAARLAELAEKKLASLEDGEDTTEDNLSKETPKAGEEAAKVAILDEDKETEAQSDCPKKTPGEELVEGVEKSTDELRELLAKSTERVEELEKRLAEAEEKDEKKEEENEKAEIRSVLDESAEYFQLSIERYADALARLNSSSLHARLGGFSPNGYYNPFQISFPEAPAYRPASLVSQWYQQPAAPQIIYMSAPTQPAATDLSLSPQTSVRQDYRSLLGLPGYSVNGANYIRL